MLLVETVLLHRQWTPAQWDTAYSDFPNRLVKVLVQDRHAFTTTDAERKVEKPEGLQAKIDEAVKDVVGGRSFVRPSGTEDCVRVYAEAATREAADREWPRRNRDAGCTRLRPSFLGYLWREAHSLASPPPQNSPTRSRTSSSTRTARGSAPSTASSKLRTSQQAYQASSTPVILPCCLLSFASIVRQELQYRHSFLRLPWPLREDAEGCGRESTSPATGATARARAYLQEFSECKASLHKASGRERVHRSRRRTAVDELLPVLCQPQPRCADTASPELYSALAAQGTSVAAPGRGNEVSLRLPLHPSWRCRRRTRQQRAGRPRQPFRGHGPPRRTRADPSAPVAPADQPRRCAPLPPFTRACPRAASTWDGGVTWVDRPRKASPPTVRSPSPAMVPHSSRSLTPVRSGSGRSRLAVPPGSHAWRLQPLPPQRRPPPRPAGRLLCRPLRCRCVQRSFARNVLRLACPSALVHAGFL